jgi:hypothetical protein
MFKVIEADIFHVHGRQHGYIRRGRGWSRSIGV